MARHMCETSQFESVIRVMRKIRESRVVNVHGINLRLSLEHNERGIEDHLTELQSESHAGIVGITTLSSVIVPYAVGDWLDEENLMFGPCRVNYEPALTYVSDGGFKNSLSERVNAEDWTSTMKAIARGLENSERLLDSLANFVLDRLDYAPRVHDAIVAAFSPIKPRRKVLRLENGTIYESGIRGTRSDDWLLLETYSERSRDLLWKGQEVHIHVIEEKAYKPCSMKFNFIQVLRDAQCLRSDRPIDLALTETRRNYDQFLKMANVPMEKAYG